MRFRRPGASDDRDSDNHTDGFWEVAPGVQNISISAMQFGSERLKDKNATSSPGNSSLAKILVRGTALSAPGTNATRIRFNGIYLGGYGDAGRPVNSFSGIRVLDLGPRDIVDIPYMNGDLEVFANTGTVLTSFHLTGVTVVSTPLGAQSDEEQALRDRRYNAADPPLFVGELMTFKCCDQDFSEYIWARPLPGVQSLSRPGLCGAHS